MEWKLEIEEFFFAGCMHNCSSGVGGVITETEVPEGE
jgi:hypothetical protein